MTGNHLNPLEEVRAIREKIGRRYKTMDEYWDHLKTVPSADILLERVQEKIARAKAKEAAAKPARRRLASRRRKALVHV